MEYQDRVNRPLGMSDVDLLIYDKDIYTMYRTHEGLEPDAFRYDPIVSAGMLASDYAYAEGMQWVNLLTPDSQDKINPGDDLVVPVRTYDYYGENLPIEKKLTHEVSYTSNQLNTARNMGLHNQFVGDFNNYFDQESGLLGEQLFGSEAELAPAPTGGGASLPPRNYEGPRTTTMLSAPIRPLTNIQFTAPTTTTTTTTTPTRVAKYRCISTAPYYVRDDVNGTKTLIQASACRPRVAPTSTGAVTVGTGGTTTGSGTTTTTSGGTTTGSGTTTTTSGGTTSGGGGEVIDGGAFPMGGGGGGASGGGAEAPAPESAPTESKKDASVKKEIKADYKFILLGIIILGAIGYYYAKSQNKDIKTFSVSGAIVGGILGYMYNQHQTKPIDLFTKLGIKGKNESGYFIDDI